MIAKRQAIGAGIEQLTRRILRQAEASRGIFRIDNDKFEFKLTLETRQVLCEGIASGAAHHITKKSKTH
jgi:hypothetical protein